MNQSSHQLKHKEDSTLSIFLVSWQNNIIYILYRCYLDKLYNANLRNGRDLAVFVMGNWMGLGWKFVSFCLRYRHLWGLQLVNCCCWSKNRYISTDSLRITVWDELWPDGTETADEDLSTNCPGKLLTVKVEELSLACNCGTLTLLFNMTELFLVAKY